MGYAAVTLLSSLVNLGHLQEASKSFGSAKYPIIAVISIFPLAVLLKNQKYHDRLKWPIFIFIASIFAAFIYSMIRIHLGFDLKYWTAGDYGKRIGGFTDVMRYGYGTAIVILAILPLVLRKRTDILRVSWVTAGLTVVVAVAGVYFSYTRGAMLGLLFGIPFSLFFFKKNLAKVLLAGSILLVAGILAVVLSGGSEKSRFLMSADNSSNTIRVSQFEAAWKLFLENPILGAGPNQFKFQVERVKKQYDIAHPEFKNEHSHNIFLEILANTGILGFVFFVGWLLLWAKEVYRGTEFEKQVFLPVILFVFIAGQFEMIMMAQTATIIYFIYALKIASENIKFGLIEKTRN
ncbi:O-antigen ligase family protein [Bdellovibrio reynosensis]|uniref:O-antigen ligase family protein n=1 Tax=Bdellovibrio reynosensis TaxID=2835041 RepID=A0ABY4CJ43_9BACT|nr:O-antigen ligase family protein [Bdellovibrio reynosensis]UOF02260.1 O-antigen ligase family protein [Bdellovibrio reynosensis]